MKYSRPSCCCCCCWVTVLLVATSLIKASPESVMIANEKFEKQQQKIQQFSYKRNIATTGIMIKYNNNNNNNNKPNQTALTTNTPTIIIMPSLGTTEAPTTTTTTTTTMTTATATAALAMHRIAMELMSLTEQRLSRAKKSTENKIEKLAVTRTTTTTTNTNPIRQISRSTNKNNKFSKRDEALAAAAAGGDESAVAVSKQQQPENQTSRTQPPQQQQQHQLILYQQPKHQKRFQQLSPESMFLESQERPGFHYNEPIVVRRSKRQATEEQSDKCRLFIEGEAAKNELYSPDYPNDYPKNINCTRVITAPKGQVIRLDFRNSFHIEAKEDCKFDFLEIRDGQYGFSNLLGKFCGTDFPPEITSQERYLWLHFHSDESIEYSGFTAVYEFIDRRRETPSTDLNCTIEKDGYEGFVNSTDVPQEIRETVIRNKIPLDCMWRVQVQDKWKIQVKFLDFKLSKPNDCESNFLDIFPEQTIMPLRVKNFCGSAGEGITSESNILHMRFYAEKEAINSTFSILFTAFRDKTNTGCTPDEYDCEDATCISLGLMCNKRDNCKFRWDELDGRCLAESNGQSEHVIIIIVVFGLLLGGMVITFLVNCIRKIMRDQKIIREHIRQSKESELNEMGRHSKARSRDNLSIAMSPRQKHSQTSLQILDDVSNRYYREVVPITVQTGKSELKEKEHSILRQHHDMFVQTSLVCDDSSSTATATEALPQGGGNVCDMACQTRESLFVSQPLREKSMSPPSGGMSMPPPPPRFSTFGYDTPQQPPPPPPPAIATLSRQAMRVPAAVVGSVELEPRQHYEGYATTAQQRAAHAPHHAPHASGMSAGRPQEVCHHHHQHQQHLQQQKYQHYQQQQLQQQQQLHFYQRQPQQQQQQQQPQTQAHQQKQPKYHQSMATIVPMTTLAATTATAATAAAASATAAMPATAPASVPASGKGKHHKMDESKVFLDIRNSAPDVIIMTSH